jgi:hypothetical protein
MEISCNRNTGMLILHNSTAVVIRNAELLEYIKFMLAKFGL